MKQLLMRCIYSNKDKNFKANHNKNARHTDALRVVSIVTKIRILKQITTGFVWDAAPHALYL